MLPVPSPSPSPSPSSGLFAVSKTRALPPTIAMRGGRLDLTDIRDGGDLRVYLSIVHPNAVATAIVCLPPKARLRGNAKRNIHDAHNLFACTCICPWPLSGERVLIASPPSLVASRKRCAYSLWVCSSCGKCRETSSKACRTAPIPSVIISARAWGSGQGASSVHEE